MRSGVSCIHAQGRALPLCPTSDCFRVMRGNAISLMTVDRLAYADLLVEAVFIRRAHGALGTCSPQL
jgi:hypothetical protein